MSIYVVQSVINYSITGFLGPAMPLVDLCDAPKAHGMLMAFTTLEDAEEFRDKHAPTAKILEMEEV